ncbi:MAG: hypothetical protein V3T83_03790, partial [Acidobacteriota bacterium]
VSEKAASADQFIDRALRWFGEANPLRLKSAWERGERLVELICASRTLLILDGLEPLQHPPGPMEGRLKDPALEALLKGLAERNAGLCVVTTREPVCELASYSRQAVPRIDLRRLDPQMGAALLRRIGVRGAEEELEEASKDYQGHALALTLLGTYLRDRHQGDVQRKGTVKLLQGHPERARHARSVMASYENWFAEEKDWAALNVLRLMGLFDRPADAAALQALRAHPIPGLSDALAEGDEERLVQAAQRLHSARLVNPEIRESRLVSMDAHPLVREYFADCLQEDFADAMKEGHRCLYEHLKESAKELPETLEEMMPLFQAVAHGCRAGLHQEVSDDVYLGRICRRDEFFAQYKLGASSADLAAVSNFFEHPWDRPSGNLTQARQSSLLSQAGFCLRALGRLSEAAEPMRAGLEGAKKQEDWKNAAARAGNLSELHLTLGDLPQAVDDARHSVELADRSKDAFEKRSKRTALADGLHQCGDLAQARSLFQQAEQMLKKEQPQDPLLYSLAGFRYCDLLLGGCEALAWTPPAPQPESAPSRPQALTRCREVRERAAQTLELMIQQEWLLDIALDHLTLGRTFLLEAVLEAPSPDLLSPAQHHLDRAVTGLREAGQQNHMPRGLITRAQLRRVQLQQTRDETFAQQAQQDLNEAAQIASRGPMPLFQADIHLEQSRLHHAQGNLDAARQALSQVRELIQKHGYHRRDAELEAAEEAVRL